MKRLPKKYPDGTKYVVEAHGSFVRRYVEFPDGRKIHLSDRKVKPSPSAEASLVPEQTEPVIANIRRIFA